MVHLDCVLETVAPGAWSDDIRVTGDDGRCSFRGVGATDVTVILRGMVDGDVIEFGRATTTVEPNRDVGVVIRVTREERPN